MVRSEARELMMQLLFQMEAQNEYNTEIKDRFLSDKGEFGNQQTYMDEVLNAVKEHISQIDQILEESSENWKISRMGKVDLAISRLAVCEMLYIESVPTSVAINEAINLAKKFGTEESGKFINGLLGKVAKKVTEG
ncbi:transcription antitermination factor NusB [Clostridium aminobutyricum]|uniref:Transcription antitermination protein NusB n=1 Tax=Clostridium aminobutyricum TaxID=33953 RepID=A0A939IG42_CLOAM|nr:transcription antitermination factor NusB [Clostridium aminobutyricum]MBN7772525.1 transcription antitermination factor NusB [Clostridium aminobutyricum]